MTNCSGDRCRCKKYWGSVNQWVTSSLLHPHSNILRGNVKVSYLFIKGGCIFGHTSSLSMVLQYFLIFCTSEWQPRLSFRVPNGSNAQLSIDFQFGFTHMSRKFLFQWGLFLNWMPDYAISGNLEKSVDNIFSNFFHFQRWLNSVLFAVLVE